MNKKQKEKEREFETRIKFLDESQWVEKVMRSCKTVSQLWIADDLVDILLKKYEKSINRKDWWLVHDYFYNVYFEMLNVVLGYVKAEER